NYAMELFESYESYDFDNIGVFPLFSVLKYGEYSFELIDVLDTNFAQTQENLIYHIYEYFNQTYNLFVDNDDSPNPLEKVNLIMLHNRMVSAATVLHTI